MTDENSQPHELDTGAPAVPERKPWSKPNLTVHRVDEVTFGLKLSTKLDDGNFFS